MLFTGERAHGKSFLGNKRFADHYERYAFAKDYCKDKDVLDVASGSGYGSFALSQVAKHVYGLDVSKDAVEYCDKHIKNKNLHFVLGDGRKFPFDDSSFDIVVSFETIEHIKDYEGFLKEIKRVLKKGGKLLISTPNFRGEIIKNKYHVSNFTTQSFITAVSKFFNIDHVFFQGRHYYPFPSRGILESVLGIKRDIKIHGKRPGYEHHVTLIDASN